VTKYHRGALTGGDINKLTIGAELQVLFQQKERKRIQPTADLDTVISNRFAILDEIMSALLAVRYYLYLAKPTAEDKMQFRHLVISFGRMWRRDFQQPVPPKLHLLEEHCAAQLDDLGTIGLFLEETIDNAHRDDNTMNRMFSNIKNWLARDKAKWMRSARESQVKVQLTKVEGNKRAYSQEKMEERHEKKAQLAIEDRVQDGVLSAAMRAPSIGPIQNSAHR
jgi:hypothetical protein